MSFSFVGSLLLAATAAGQAGGLYFPENGGPISGNAQAGSAAVARDAETAWLNPAGMTQLDSPEVMLSLMPFYLDFSFNRSSSTTAGGSSGGDQGGFFPAGALFVAVPINERVAAGFSVTSPAGLVIDPSNDWVGRTSVTEVTLLAMNFEPSIGVQLAEKWSLGFGLDLQYVAFDQDVRGPLLGNSLGVDGDNWDVGASVSLLWQPLETTRIGVRYRSEVDHDLSGDFTVTQGTTPIETGFTMPMSATVSGYHDLTERFALLAEVGWTDWSAFDYNVISFDNTGTSIEIRRDFTSTWNVSLGTHFRPAERWLIMFGAGYVTSAVSDSDRTVDIPVDQQVRVSTGLEFEVNERWTVGGNYTFAWLGDNDIDQPVPIASRVVGDYDAFAHIFGIYGSLTF